MFSRKKMPGDYFMEVLLDIGMGESSPSRDNPGVLHVRILKGKEGSKSTHLVESESYDWFDEFPKEIFFTSSEICFVGEKADLTIPYKIPNEVGKAQLAIVPSTSFYKSWENVKSLKKQRKRAPRVKNLSREKSTFIFDSLSEISKDMRNSKRLKMKAKLSDLAKKLGFVRNGEVAPWRCFMPSGYRLSIEQQLKVINLFSENPKHIKQLIDLGIVEALDEQILKEITELNNTYSLRAILKANRKNIEEKHILIALKYFLKIRGESTETAGNGKSLFELILSFRWHPENMESTLRNGLTDLEAIKLFRILSFRLLRDQRLFESTVNWLNVLFDAHKASLLKSEKLKARMKRCVEVLEEMSALGLSFNPVWMLAPKSKREKKPPKLKIIPPKTHFFVENLVVDWNVVDGTVREVPIIKSS